MNNSLLSITGRGGRSGVTHSKKKKKENCQPRILYTTQTSKTEKQKQINKK